MAPALTGVLQGTISAATYAATEKIAYGRNPSLKDTLQVGSTSGVMAGGIYNEVIDIPTEHPQKRDLLNLFNNVCQSQWK